MAGCSDERNCAVHSCAVVSVGAGGSEGRDYPGEPGIGVRAKGKLPRGLERLEELVGLEKGAQGQSVCEAKGEQQSKKRVQQRRVTIAGRESWWCW